MFSFLYQGGNEQNLQQNAPQEGMKRNEHNEKS